MNKKVYIDTNIFLRFLVFDKKNPQLSTKAKSIIQKIEKGTVIAQTNILIISELVYVLEGYYEQSKEEILEKIVPLINLTHLHIEKKSLTLSTLYVYRDKNVDFEDAYTYTLMQEEKIKSIYTFDKTHFKRFEGINISN